MKERIVDSKQAQGKDICGSSNNLTGSAQEKPIKTATSPTSLLHGECLYIMYFGEQKYVFVYIQYVIHLEFLEIH